MNITNAGVRELPYRMKPKRSQGTYYEEGQFLMVDFVGPIDLPNKLKELMYKQPEIFRTNVYNYDDYFIGSPYRKSARRAMKRDERKKKKEIDQREHTFLDINQKNLIVKIPNKIKSEE